MINKIPEYIQRPLLPLTVTVIGAGGTGSMFAQHLARIAYSYHGLNQRRRLQVVIADGDKVEYPNIGRQLFASNELGYAKSSVVVNRTNRVYGFDWLAYPQHFRYKSLNDKNKEEWSQMVQSLSANVIVTCTDNVESRRNVKAFIDEVRKIMGTPEKKTQHFLDEYYPYFWIDLGNTKTLGQMVVDCPLMGWPDVLTEYGHLYPDVEDDEPSCDLAMALNKQDLFINSFMAVTAAKWLWEAISQRTIDWRGAFVNLDSLQINKLKVKDEADANPPARKSQGRKRAGHSKANPKGTRQPRIRTVEHQAGSRSRSGQPA